MQAVSVSTCKWQSNINVCRIISHCIQIWLSKFQIRFSKFLHCVFPTWLHRGSWFVCSSVSPPVTRLSHSIHSYGEIIWWMQLLYVFVTLFSPKWLNCQSPRNYLRGAGKGTASKRLMREYWICTSIRVLIKCGLHKDSRATTLTQLPQCTMGGGTAGRRVGQWRRQGKRARWQKKAWGEKVRDSWCDQSRVFILAGAEKRIK